MAKFEIMALPRKYILFIMCIVGLGRPALFANEVHKFTHTHTSNILYIYIYIYCSKRMGLKEISVNIPKTAAN